MGFFDVDANETVAETNVDDATSEIVLDNNTDVDDEVDTENDSNPDYDLIISPDTFERFASIIAFLFGIFINWGSLNAVGFMIGLNYKYLLNGSSYNKLANEVQTIIPAFMLGVLIVHLSLIYFTLSVFVGYAVKSKNLSVFDENFFRRNSVQINIRNYKGAFYELIGFLANANENENNEKKES